MKKNQFQSIGKFTMKSNYKKKPGSLHITHSDIFLQNLHWTRQRTQLYYITHTCTYM